VLKIKETPHRGHTFTWYAENEDDFCLKLMSAYSRGDWENVWTFEQFVDWLRSDLEDLHIEFIE